MPLWSPAVPLHVSAWHWVGFTAFVLGAIFVDLSLLHRTRRELSFREAIAWTALWVLLAVFFAVIAGPQWIHGWSRKHTATFLTGYVVELALSMDNVFVIAVIFRFFKVPAASQHGLLFWGVLGALLMRGVLIVAGAALVSRFHAVLYVMGLFLLLTGAKMLWRHGDEEEADLAQNPVLAFLRRWLPFSAEYSGEAFWVLQAGRRVFTPLFLALVVIETTDAAFALDSIPAIFGITSDAFLVYTSNIFAILGLRSLFFVLAAVMGYFRLLKHGLALVLVLIGIKMLAEKPLQAWFGERLTTVSLVAVLGLITASMAASVVLGWRERRLAAAGGGAGGAER